jgi:hypothetical protein
VSPRNQRNNDNPEDSRIIDEALFGVWTCAMLWLANNLSAGNDGNDLTFRAGETKNRGSCRSSSCAWRIHRITRQSVSGKARDSASASDTRQSLSATQVRQNQARGLLTPRASGAH